MSIQQYEAIDGLQCEECGTHEDVTFDEGGRELCFDCLFEISCLAESPKRCQQWSDHEFVEDYYGLTCERCGLLVPDGHGPWMPTED